MNVCKTNVFKVCLLFLILKKKMTEFSFPFISFLCNFVKYLATSRLDRESSLDVYIQLFLSPEAITVALLSIFQKKVIRLVFIFDRPTL